MGCINSTPRPPRPAPLPFDGGAPELILTKRGSPLQITLENWQQLKQGEAVPLHLASHPGYAIVPRAPEQGPVHVGPPCGGDDWMYVELGVGPSDKALKAAFDKQGFFTSSHAPNSMRGDSASAPPSMVFDISWWKYEEGNTVNLVGEARSNERSRDTGGGRTFTINEDGSVSNSRNPHLVLGVNLPDITLVNATSPNALTFDVAAGPRGLSSGQSVPLTLASHPGLAVCPKTEPRRINEWGVSYQHWGLGEAKNAMTVKKEGEFILSTHPSSLNFVLDVPFDKRVEGCEGMPLAVIYFDNGSNKEEGNKARKFMVNPNGTLSPVASPHLVLGVRDGKSPVPAKASGSFCPACGHHNDDNKFCRNCGSPLSPPSFFRTSV